MTTLPEKERKYASDYKLITMIYSCLEFRVLDIFGYSNIITEQIISYLFERA